MRFFVLSCIYLIIFSTVLTAQHYKTWPLKKVRFTGNYGEIRPNHFHAGLDFSGTFDRNQPIYCVKDGYVSRIKVSPYGYGKVIYITHYDGYVSAYAHQSKFNDFLEFYVRKAQYLNENYEVELFPKKNEINLKEGELIGYMGNTGGSTGPHLHFEIRNELSEIPLNPLLYYHFIDSIRPVLSHLVIYNQSDTLNPKINKIIKLNEKSDQISIQNAVITLTSSIFSIGYVGYDQEMIGGGKNNIYSAKLFLDEQLIYEHNLNSIPFDYSNYVNVFADRYKNLTIQKCFPSENFPSEMYKTIKNRGRVHLKDTKIHALKLQVSDEFGTIKTLNFFVQCSIPTSFNKIDTKNFNYFNCKVSNFYSQNNYTLTIPENAAYNSSYLFLEGDFLSKNFLDIKAEHNGLRTTANLKVKVDPKLLVYKDKIVFKNYHSILIPTFTNNIAEINFKYFGPIELLIDTLAPHIKLIYSDAYLQKNSKSLKSISFKIGDDISGISKYRLEINNKWELAEFDAKSKLVTYYFDSSSPKGQLLIKLRVEDRVNNISEQTLIIQR